MIDIIDSIRQANRPDFSIEDVRACPICTIKMKQCPYCNSFYCETDGCSRAAQDQNHLESCRESNQP